MGAQFSQFFPPTATFTAASIGSQAGKVFLITGGYSGIGLELAKILYTKGGKVYIAGRSDAKARQAIELIESLPTQVNGGSVHFLSLELDDLSTIKPAVDAFIAKEAKLDVLWNNAGVSQPPLGSVSKQGFELQLATNCLGPILLTNLLLPLLAQHGRVVWLSSQIMELSAPKGALDIADLTTPPRDQNRNYVLSKTVNYLLSCELARRQPRITSVAINPGAATTNLFRHTPYLRYLAWPLLHDAKLAAYTELFAGLAEDVPSGGYVVPWGRVSTQVREDLVVAAGGVKATEVWGFCQDATEEFAK
jgi:NAD(P)-dependent dehydrogenase (short-subunit alcohol dehydrogenase family)